MSSWIALMWTSGYFVIVDFRAWSIAAGKAKFDIGDPWGPPAVKDFKCSNSKVWPRM